MAAEINRAPAKVQAALLEAMEERQVTVAGTTHRMEPLVMVMATQNPIEQEGTYPLPEAQMDRFMFKINVEYPNKGEELEIMNRMSTDNTPTVQSVITKENLMKAREMTDQVYVDDNVKTYIVDIVMATGWTEHRGSPQLVTDQVSPF